MRVQVWGRGKVFQRQPREGKSSGKEVSALAAEVNRGNSGIVPPTSSMKAAWKLSPSNAQAVRGDVVGIEYPREGKNGSSKLKIQT